MNSSELLKWLASRPDLPINLTVEVGGKQYAAPLTDVALKKSFKNNQTDGTAIGVELVASPTFQ